MFMNVISSDQFEATQGDNTKRISHDCVRGYKISIDFLTSGFLWVLHMFDIWYDDAVHKEKYEMSDRNIELVFHSWKIFTTYNQ